MSFIRTTRRIGGMHCIRCEAAVKKALSDLPGLENIDVSYARGTLIADWDSEILPEAIIRDKLTKAGYSFRETRPLTELCKVAGLVLICFGLFELILRNPIVSRLNLFPTATAGMSLGAVFLVGVMTSLHCVAMCGGINLSQSGNSAVRGRNPWKSNLRYNLGRLISYTLTGIIVGALGSVFSLDTRVKAGIQLIAAIFMVLMACNLSGLFPLLQCFSIHLPKGMYSRIPLIEKFDPSFGVGLINGLMPCGPLQSMQLFALSTGSWWMGGLSMFAFALGTVPLMFGFGLAGGLLTGRFGKPLQWLSAALVLFMGIGMFTNAVSLAGINASAPAASQLTAEVSKDNSVQSITTELDWNSYPDFIVRAGTPVKWTLHASSDKLIGCNNEILIPAFNIDVHLVEGDNIIEFTPTSPGSIPYSCWMGMIRASITVIDP